MKQSSSLTCNLAEAQEEHAHRARNAPAFNTPKTLYRLYTEHLAHVNAQGIVGRYFAGATIYNGLGLDARTQDASEDALIIEIVSSAPDGLQRAIDLAGDLRTLGNQVSVLVTVQDVRTFEITGQRQRPLDHPSDSPRYNAASKAQTHRLAGI